MRVNGITGTADVPSVAVHKLQAGDLVIEENPLAGRLGRRSWPERMAFLRRRRPQGGKHLRGLSPQSGHDLPLAGWGARPAGFSRVAGQRLEGGLLIVPRPDRWNPRFRRSSIPALSGRSAI